MYQPVASVDGKTFCEEDQASSSFETSSSDDVSSTSLTTPASSSVSSSLSTYSYPFWTSYSYNSTSSPYNPTTYNPTYNYYANMAPEYTGYSAYASNSEISSDAISNTSNASASSCWASNSFIQAESSTSFGKNYYESSANSTDSSPAIESPVAINLYPSFARQASPSLNESATETQQPTETETTSYTTKPTKLSRKHQLPDRAVEIMNEWFEEHENNPYPQLCEKEIMAQRGGISVKQVTAWFSNRRNRSQNTKPKRMQRVIKENFNKICQELAYNPDRDLVAEKVRHFQETLEKRY